jgi:hypothetical protein
MRKAKRKTSSSQRKAEEPREVPDEERNPPSIRLTPEQWEAWEAEERKIAEVRAALDRAAAEEIAANRAMVRLEKYLKSKNKKSSLQPRLGSQQSRGMPLRGPHGSKPVIPILRKYWPPDGKAPLNVSETESKDVVRKVGDEYQKCTGDTVTPVTIKRHAGLLARN